MMKTECAKGQQEEKIDRSVTVSEGHFSHDEKDPVLTLDFKKKRIRLFKHTMTMIGNPDYVQILVNPKTSVIMFQRCSEDDCSAHKVYWNSLKDKKQCCELYSKVFLEALYYNFFPHEEECSYRVYGTSEYMKGRVIFDLNNCIKLADAEA